MIIELTAHGCIRGREHNFFFQCHDSGRKRFPALLQSMFLAGRLPANVFCDVYRAAVNLRMESV